MQLPDLTAMDAAAEEVYRHMLPSPLLQWPLLSRRCGRTVWVKHENHNPTGAFKVRGGLVYLSRLRAREPAVTGVVTATRGNHGQSIAFAAARFGLRAVVVVPEGNNPDKNAAMQALGAELIVHGRDFDEAVPHAIMLAEEQGLHRLPSFHPDLVSGVASYALEMFRTRSQLKRVYVPIGLGSGICAVIAARNALGLATEVVGVAAANADCYARSLAVGRCVTTETAHTLADGMAVRVPDPDALACLQANIERIITVQDSDILAAMGYFFSDTHNIAEGAGAAPLAALLKDEGSGLPTDEVALVLSGGNADRGLYTEALVEGAA